MSGPKARLEIIGCTAMACLLAMLFTLDANMKNRSLPPVCAVTDSTKNVTFAALQHRD
jgi:hypothetical protein